MRSSTCLNLMEKEDKVCNDERRWSNLATSAFITRNVRKTITSKLHYCPYSWAPLGFSTHRFWFMSPSIADVLQLLVKPLPRLRTQSCVSVEVDMPADGDNPWCTDNTASPPNRHHVPQFYRSIDVQRGAAAFSPPKHSKNNSTICNRVDFYVVQ